MLAAVYLQYKMDGLIGVTIDRRCDEPAIK
jgi:hypothetical protein